MGLVKKQAKFLLFCEKRKNVFGEEKVFGLQVDRENADEYNGSNKKHKEASRWNPQVVRAQRAGIWATFRYGEHLSCRTLHNLFE